jgi:hypothetical protein
MAGEERKPDARRVFRFLAGVIAVFCFILFAWFVFGPDRGDAGLLPFFFLASGFMMAGLALTGNVPWWGRGGTSGTNAKAALSDRVKQLASDPSKKIEAIKTYREETGAGLAEAKEAVEAFINSK